MTIDTESLNHSNLAARLETDGFTPHERAVRSVIAGAQRHGVNPVLLAVLGDRREAEVARARAFGRISTRLAAIADTPPASPATTLSQRPAA